MFSAYVLDPRDGWTAVHRLSLMTAIHYCREFREHTAGSLVAIVPDGVDPDPFLTLVGSL